MTRFGALAGRPWAVAIFGEYAAAWAESQARIWSTPFASKSTNSSSDFASPSRAMSGKAERQGIATTDALRRVHGQDVGMARPVRSSYGQDATRAEETLETVETARRNLSSIVTRWRQGCEAERPMGNGGGSKVDCPVRHRRTFRPIHPTMAAVTSARHPGVCGRG